MIDLEAVGKIADSFATLVRVGNDDDFVPAIYEFLWQVSVFHPGCALGSYC